MGDDRWERRELKDERGKEEVGEWDWNRILGSNLL
jgi:hypothetical protein